MKKEEAKKKMREMGLKRCSKCKDIKSYSSFHRNKSTIDGRVSQCKHCIKEKSQEKNKDKIEAKKQWAAGAKERTKIRDAAHYQENKERIRERNRKWSQANKHKRRARERERLKKDPLYRLSRVLRSRIHKALKNETKETSSTDLLGCSTKHARQHLESQFTKGMTWKNHGVRGWHIDHIIPCDSFDLSDINQKKQCFHYTNLQPLWHKENLSKGDKLPDQHQPQLAIPI